MAGEFPDVFSNPRGLGLFAAFDVVTPEKRTEIRNAAFDLGLIVLPCGERTIRFRPPLNVTKEEIDLGIEIIRKALTHE
jgi:L-lysine 6-transaminase